MLPNFNESDVPRAKRICQPSSRLDSSVVMSSTGEQSILTDQNLNIKATFMEVIDVVSSELKRRFNHHDIYKCVEALNPQMNSFLDYGKLYH